MRQTEIGTAAQRGLALLRIALGVILLVTWADNLSKGLYTAAGLRDFLNWLFSPEGNNSSLTAYKTILDATVIPAAGLFGAFQLVGELLMGLALLSGTLTRFFGAAAMFFFGNLFLSYFGGEEWIWTYVLLFSAALALTMGYAGRYWGVDRRLAAQRGEPPFPLLW